jgi:hypothetical protein
MQEKIDPKMCVQARLDANFISTESFTLFAKAATVRATYRATAATKIITLAVANSSAMAHNADGMIMQAACVVAGFAVVSGA